VRQNHLTRQAAFETDGQRFCRHPVQLQPAVLRACIKALQLCHGTEGLTFADAAISKREQNRLIGRPLPKRAVGSTLLLKGLEAEVAVVLDASNLDARIMSR
jgi:hypothetical protein